MAAAIRLDSSGRADVIVVLKNQMSPDREARANAVEDATVLNKHFTPVLGAARETAPAAKLLPNLGIMIGQIDAGGLAALRSHQMVEAVLPAPVFTLIRAVATEPQAPAPEITWGLKQLGIPQLWDAGYTGRGIAVGHLDTGIDGAHPALAGAIKAFAEFDAAGNLVPDAPTTDSGDHGTHTAGTIAARTTAASTFGVAPGAQLISAKVIEGGQVTRRILAGMDWAIGEGIRILNMSVGVPGYDPSFLPIVQIVRSRDILPVFAIGNDGEGTSRSPGNYAEALSVGALDPSMIVSAYSCSQRFDRPVNPVVPDIVAPGAAVLSCIPGARYAKKYGTSQAAPHISGLAALLMEAKPSADIAAIEQAILAASTRPASISEDRGNHGVPFGPAALASLTAAVG
ncbi:MAG: serine protease [Alphaproteobacteria bacterium]|nr:MAG: serine protease [Alphaproteobacteria bacterium]